MPTDSSRCVCSEICLCMYILYLARADHDVGLDSDVVAVPDLDDAGGDPGAGGQRDHAVFAALDLELDDRAALACPILRPNNTVRATIRRGGKEEKRAA